MYYRNKSIFGWNNYEKNLISSIISQNIFQYMKFNIINDNIHNIVIRDMNNQIGIIIIMNSKYDNINYNKYYELCDNYCYNNNYQLKYFEIQFNDYKMNFKNEFIIFDYNVIDEKKIYLLPNSFFQCDINKLHIFYRFFIKSIKYCKSNNFINLGDDGGNIGILLSSLFNNIQIYFHCINSYNCCLEMIKNNSIQNMNITMNINNINILDNTILFINPGRKGLKDYEIEFIKKSNIKYVIYMSCNHKSFIKDINKINYTIIDKINFINMDIINKKQYIYLLNIIYQLKN